MDNLIMQARKKHGFLGGFFSTKSKFKFDKRWNSFYHVHESNVRIDGIDITNDGFRDESHSFNVSFRTTTMKKIEQITFNSYNLRRLFFYCGDHYALKVNYEKNKKFEYCLNLKWITEDFGEFTLVTKKASFEYFEVLAKSAKEFDILLSDIFKKSDYGISEYAQKKLIKDFTSIATVVSKLFAYKERQDSLYYYHCGEITFKDRNHQSWPGVLYHEVSLLDIKNIILLLKEYIPEFGDSTEITIESAYQILKERKLKEIGLM